MNPSACGRFYLQQGPIFSDEWNPNHGWTQMNEAVVVPETVQFNVGQEPGKVVFHVFADGFGPVYSPVTSAIDPSGIRPDGGIGGLVLPSVSGSPLLPFTTIRLMEGSNEEGGESTARFVGVFLNAELDLANEVWICSALDVVRWRMSKYTVTGELWHDTNLEGHTPPADVNPVWFSKVLPVFNPQGNQFYPYGRRNMWLDPSGTGYLPDSARKLEFYHPEYRVNNVYKETYWRIGDCINYLREIYFKNATPDIFGMKDFLNWDQVTPTTHPYLFQDYAGNELIVPDLCLGGMKLSEAIDCLVRKAGYGSEWTVSFDGSGGEDSCPYTLEFFNQYGIGNLSITTGPKDVTLTRGIPATPIGDTPADIAKGIINLDWSDSAGDVRVFAQTDKHEVTIGYDPQNVSGGIILDMLEPVWDEDAQKMYQYTWANYSWQNTLSWDQNFPGLFTRFRIKESAYWTDAFGPAFDPSHQGVRDIIGGMLTKLALGVQEIQAKVWRWNSGLTGSNKLECQNGDISLGVFADNAINIHGKYSPGYDEDLAVIPDAVTSLPYLCQFVPGNTWTPTGGDWVPWTIRPFAITLTVEGDQRSYGEDTGPLPANWPDSLEDTPDLYPFGNHWRYKVRHFLDAGGNPVELNPISATNVSPVPEMLVDNQDRINAAATKRKNAVQRPRCVMSLTLPTFNWDAMPGCRVYKLTGGEAIQDIYMGTLIKTVHFLGLGSKGSIEQAQVLECGNG